MARDIKDIQPLTGMLRWLPAVDIIRRQRPKHVKRIIDVEFKLGQLALSLVREPDLLESNVLSNSIDYVLSPTGDDLAPIN